MVFNEHSLFLSLFCLSQCYRSITRDKFTADSLSFSFSSSSSLFPLSPYSPSPCFIFLLLTHFSRRINHFLPRFSALFPLPHLFCLPSSYAYISFISVTILFLFLLFLLFVLLVHHPHLHLPSPFLSFLTFVLYHLPFSSLFC